MNRTEIFIVKVKPMMMPQNPSEERQPLQEYFRTLLHTVVGQAFEAAGYTLKEEPFRWINGRFRYEKVLDDGFIAYMEFQVLVAADNMWSAGMPSRFTVTLYRSDQPGGRPSNHDRYARRLLSMLVVDDFGVDILPDREYWWEFRDTESLGKALAEAGHLVIGYGMPWLAGELSPDDVQARDEPTSD